MATVPLNYFEAAYNKLNQKTVVTDIETSWAVLYQRFTIGVGIPDGDCTVNCDEDMITVINKVKPDEVCLKQENEKVQAFCEQIGIPCEVVKHSGVFIDLNEDPDLTEDLTEDLIEEFTEDEQEE